MVPRLFYALSWGSVLRVLAIEPCWKSRLPILESLWVPMIRLLGRATCELVATQVFVLMTYLLFRETLTLVPVLTK